MAMLNLFYIFLFCLQFQCCFVGSLKRTKSSQSFNGAILFHKNARLLYHEIETITVASVISCGQACLLHRHCISTNFQTEPQSKDMLCQLNDFGISESLQDQKDLQAQEGFLYTQYFIKNCPTGYKCSRKSCEGNKKKEESSRTNNLPSCHCCPSLTGNSYDNTTVTVTVFNFTTLGAVGKQGPNCDLGYPQRHMKNVTIQNGLQHWVVPISGQYEIVLHGASGGDGTKGNKGGRGAVANGTMYLSRGTELKILIGQRGLDGGPKNVGSGGGGTFVAFAYNDSGPISVAGGGGGGGVTAGDPGQNGTSGSPTKAGGKNMAGGLVCWLMGTGTGSGGGYHGDGNCYDSFPCVAKVCDQGGKSFLHGGEGGTGLLPSCNGGFGGGGACSNVPGGGGGYSGGGIEFSYVNMSLSGAAGGGGSYTRYQNWTITQGQHAGDGFALFRLLQ